MALVGIIGFLSQGSIEFIKMLLLEGVSLNLGWFPLKGEFNFFPMIVGSFLLAIGTVGILIPWSYASVLALYLYLPYKSRKFFRFIFVLMAGMPTVVIGFWGLEVIAPFLGKWFAPGTGILCAVLVLCCMTYPSSMVLIMDRVEQFPQNIRTSSFALGVSKGTFLKRVVLPALVSDLIAIYVLAMTRAIGETIAVVMVAGNVVQIPDSVSSSFRSLTANIILEMPYAMDSHRSSLFFSALILTCICFLLVLFVHRILRERII